ncbi:MAG: hypothetical protein K2K55_02360 [Duncaniella sp.]|nr:hypothetical protein [Duncaniella sp.]
MTSSFVITPRVIQTINSMTPDDRSVISQALSMEYILGENPDTILSPMQKVLYAIIRFYVRQDTERRLNQQ